MEGTLECDYLALAVVEVAVVLGGWEAGLDASYFVAVELVVGQHCCTCPYCEDSDDLSPIEIKKLLGPAQFLLGFSQLTSFTCPCML